MLTSFEPVKVWDTVGEDKILKGEYKVLAGKMYVVESAFLAGTRWLTILGFSNDLDWDGESKRIIAVGEGRDKSVV